MTDFALKDFIEEISVLISERTEFLESKLRRHAIGEPEANLARFRLDRMQALRKYLERIRDFQENKMDEKPTPPAENRPPEQKPEEKQPAEVEEPADDIGW